MKNPRIFVLFVLLVLLLFVGWVMGPTGAPWAREQMLQRKTMHAEDRWGVLHLKVVRPWIGRDSAHLSKIELWHGSTGFSAYLQENRNDGVRITDFGLDGQILSQAQTVPGKTIAKATSPPWLWEVGPKIAPWIAGGQTAEEWFDGGSLFLVGDVSDWAAAEELMPSPQQH